MKHAEEVIDIIDRSLPGPVRKPGSTTVDDFN